VRRVYSGADEADAMGTARRKAGGRAASGSRSDLRSLGDLSTLREFVKNVREGIYITSLDGRILDANPAFFETFGVYGLAQLRRYRTPQLLVDPARRKEELAQLLQLGAVREFELQIRRPDGAVRTVLDTCYARHDRRTGETVFHGILVDITARKDLENQLREAGMRDPLTGLYNRRYLDELEARIAASGDPFGAIVIDVDHFKDYNDRFGHKTGDEVLLRVGRFLAQQLRVEDVVARIGGDEFLGLLVGETARHTGLVARRMRRAAAQSAPVPFTLGWASAREGETIEQVVNRADRRLILVRARERGLERRKQAAFRFPTMPPPRGSK
jgi:diguanylate cyclase (GGDEF)-like protein/PAS domain S-box-containing protein